MAASRSGRRPQGDDAARHARRRGWSSPLRPADRRFGSIADKACGDVAQCLNTHDGVAFSADAEYWFTRFMAAEVGYFRPADVTVNGNPTGYTFDSRVQTRLFTIVGKGGGAYRSGAPVRTRRRQSSRGHLHHDPDTSTSKTIVVNNVTQTIPGGTQSFGWKTEGWGWVAGGGVEAWVNNWIAIYGEFEHRRRSRAILVRHR